MPEGGSDIRHPSALDDGTTATPDAGATTVLMVDDRPENLLALEGILEPVAEELNVRLVRATTSEQALQHISVNEGGVALVLLDVEMPGTGGLETARLIRERAHHGHVPIIFITAQDEDRRKLTLGYQFGAVDYLRKPINPETLTAKVRAFIGLHQRRGDAVLAERRRYADQVQAMREANLRDEATLVATVHRVGNALASQLDLEKVVQLVTDEATALTHAEFGAFFYNVNDPERGGEAYTLYALAGVPREHFENFPHPRSTPLFGPTFRGEAVVRSNDITNDPRYGNIAPHFGMPTGHLSVRSYLAVPVKSRTGEVLGGLFFGHERVGVFTEREERLVVGVAGWAAVAMDNARLYAAERVARESAETGARTKAEFLATMSHEFRTPLNAILGYAQLLDMGVLGPSTAAQQEHLGRLQSSARHLLQLVDDVLDVAKVDAERLAVRHDALMTGAVVAAAVVLVQPQATAKGVRLVDNGEGIAGVPFLGDEHRVRQILVNLLSNAVKFTPSGGQVTLTCGSRPHPEPGIWRGAKGQVDVDEEAPWSFIRIEDTGPGIAPDLANRLFEPFVQGDSALTREKGGTGLGLAISRRLARLMGGDLVARSEPGAPGTFTLWLRSYEVSAVDSVAKIPSERTPRRTPEGNRPVAAEVDAPLNAAAYDVLHALSFTLASEAETIAQKYIHALRADPHFPGARTLPVVQLRDHVTPFIGLLASQLMIIGETRGQAPELLGDGGQIQRSMAELHGAQRYRLGWTESDIERETPLLIAEVESAIRAAVNTNVVKAATDSAGAVQIEYSKEAVESSMQYAMVVTRHILEQASVSAIRAFRFARSSDL